MTQNPTELPEKEINFEHLVTLPDCAYLKMSAGYRILYANPFFFDLLGYTKDEFQDLHMNSLTKVVYQEDRQKLPAAMSRQLSMGTTFQFEFRVERKNGTIIWLFMRGKLVMEQNVPIYYAAAMDITSSKEAFSDLSHAKSDLDVITNNIPGGILKLRLCDFKIIYANDGFYNLSGYSRYEYEYRFNGYANGVIHPDDAKGIRKLFLEAERTHQKFSIAYRILNADGDVHWSQAVGNYIGDIDNSAVYLFIIVDITKLKSYEEELTLEHTKHNLLCELNQEYVWEYDVVSHTIQRSGNLTESYSMEELLSGGVEELLQNKTVHPDDAERFQLFFDSIESGRPTILMDFRLKNHLGIYTWYKLQGITIFDEHQNPIKVIGKTTNIDQSKQQMDALLEEASRDSLTKTLNHETTEQRINQYLKNKVVEHTSALLMADIRNCRGIQQKYGRLFTDSVIYEVASKIITTFPNEIIGRTGMDVFVIFLPEISSEEDVLQKAHALADNIRSIYTGQSMDLNVYCNIGIAVSNEPNDSFASLFKKADMALFAAKEDEDCICNIFHNTPVLSKDMSVPDADTDTKDPDTVKTHKKSHSMRKYLWSSDDYDLLSDCTRLLLGDKTSFEVSIRQVLAKLCNYFHATQAFIIEDQPQKSISCATYTYFMPDSPAITNSFLTQPLNLTSSYQKVFNNNGMFYGNLSAIQSVCPYMYETLALMNVKSVLQGAFYDHDGYFGYLSITDCNVERIWSEHDIQTLKILCSIINHILVDRRKLQETLEVDSFDDVTGLPKFSVFLRDANECIKNQAASGMHYALASIDINKFHHYNINYGFSIGNKILVHATTLLKKYIGPHELFSRLHNDMFYILFSYEEESSFRQRLNDLIASLNQQRYNAVDYLKFTIACGICLCGENDTDISLLVDKANYTRKLSKNITDVHSYSIYSEQTALMENEAKELSSDIKTALANHEFEICYQPGYDMLNETICRADTCIQWVRPGKPAVPQETFLPLMEQEGLSCDFDFYIIEEVCRHIKDQMKAGIRPLPVSIHLSRAHLHSVYFVEKVLAIIKRYRISIEYIQFCIPEKLFVEEPESLQSLLVDLKELGFHIILDDFGREYGSLRVIKDFPIDSICLDISLFHRQLAEPKEHIIFHKIIDTAKALGITVIVTNVESEYQAAAMKEFGCDIAQGSFYHNALPINMFEQYLI